MKNNLCIINQCNFFSFCEIHREHNAKVCIVYAGTGKEENRNNAYPRNASFAQPSGLVNPHVDYLGCMYSADSESSSIRSISLSNGAVKGVVGGDLDPMVRNRK